VTNLLVYDPGETCAVLLRSYLRALGHRVSTSCDAAEAALKLQTGLFDAFCFVGDAIDPALAGVEAAAPAVIIVGSDRVEAVTPDGRRLARPRRLEAVGRIVAALGRSRPSHFYPAVLERAGVLTECRAADLRLPSVQLEPEAGAEEPFSAFFAAVGPEPFAARIQLAPDRRIESAGRCLFAERNFLGAVERAAIRLTDASAAA
jgi:hypothetical protein